MAKNTSAPLYLTAKEQAVFAKLPQDVQGDWKVEIETLTFEDSDEQIETRMRNLSLEHPELKKLQEKAAKTKLTQKEIAELAQTVDLSSLSENDLMELSFAWGPNVFTTMIAAMFSEAFSRDSVQDLAQLSRIRHGLLLAMNRTFP